MTVTIRNLRAFRTYVLIDRRAQMVEAVAKCVNCGLGVAVSGDPGPAFGRIRLRAVKSLEEMNPHLCPRCGVMMVVQSKA